MLRQRVRPVTATAAAAAAGAAAGTAVGSGEEDDSKVADKGPRPEVVGGAQSFVRTKSLILRLLGIIYVIAFKVAADQNPALIGARGLTPVAEGFNRQVQRASSPWDGFQRAPTIFWWVRLSDESLAAVAHLGLVGGALLAAGFFSSFLCAALWLLYFSIVTVAQGTAWYSYGWESQLLETGFLAIFLCSPFDLRAPPTLASLWLFRWLAFRISTGAGLIKVRGSSCWSERTCLWYHFETQPNPSPMSFVWHFLPHEWLSLGVDLDIFVQLYAVWLVLVPGFGPLRYVRRVGGIIQALFMLNIAISGNLSFLNHLTIIPALACLDDACFPRLPCLPRKELEPKASSCCWRIGSATRLVVDAALLLTIAYLSAPVVQNLLQLGGTRQVMNASFGAFRLVNTYGAFGNVGQARYEPVVSVSHDDGSSWVELEFPCKPGRLDRPPCMCAPYHYRLDWNIWFLGFKPHRRYLEQRETWMWPFLQRVLDADESALGLLAAETRLGPAFRPVDGRGGPGPRRPRLVKVEMWRYRMRAPLWEILRDYVANGTSVWWSRSYEEQLIPPISRESELLRRMLQRYGFNG